MSTNLPGQDGVLRTEVGRRLAEASKSGVGLQALVESMAPTIDSERIEEALSSLQSLGEAVEWEGRWLSVRATNWVVGRVHKLERGDAVLRSGAAGEAGHFIARRYLKAARDGDLVVAQLRPRPKRRRRTHRLPEAAVLKVLKRRIERIVGSVERRHGQARLLPFDPRLSVEVILDGANEVEKGSYVVAESEHGAAARGGKPRATVREELGAISDPGVDVLVTLRHLEIPDEFPAAVERAAVAFPADPLPTAWAGREDLRKKTIVTIDGETARDFDDGISVVERAGGGFELGVHIADVSHYVEEGSVLDLEAYQRGTSVYFPDRAVPMLPEGLSNGLCSLRPNVPRLTLSAFLEISPAGKVTGRRFACSVIESKRRLTYSEVRRLLEDPQPEDDAAYGEVLPTLKVAERLMRVLLERRIGRGSIDFDLPEGDVILDLDGAAVGVRPGERNVAHRMIEEFMIAANEAVARELEGAAMPALYRVHEEPDRQRLHELRELLIPLGIDLDLSDQSLHPSALQEVLRQVEGSPSEPFVASLVLRGMKRARYDPECRGHYALSSRHYTHFTSPIRRYPDLLVHRQLKELLGAATGDSGKEELLLSRLPTIAEHTSSTEARAERAERLILQWKVVRMLAGREGEEFSARVTGVQPYGMFMQLVDFYVDGLLPLAHLRDDFYEYRAERHELVGRKGRTFRLADEVTVVLDEVDLARRRLLLGQPAADGLG